jgi:peptidoglycan/LPS O-acetylase OafA/YrhL
LRILPALAATLILASLLRQTSLSGLALSIFFLVNYAANLGVAGVYAPLWSLGVEEHFYLLWPTVIHRFKTRAIMGIAVTLCLLEPVLRYFSGRLQLGDPHGNTHLIADYLAVGALLAIFARSRFATRRNSTLLGVGSSLAGVALLLVGIPHGILHRDNSFGDALQVVPFNLMFAGTLVLALALRLKFFASFWAWPLRYLGHISYGLYLFHMLVFSLVSTIMARYGIFQDVGHFHLVVARFLVMFAASLLFSDASRRWLEEPFLDMKKHLIR